MNSGQALKLATRLVAARSAVTPSVAVRAMSARPGLEEHKPFTLNDMPVPHGDWQSDYNRKQKSYNLHLGVGTSFFLFTVYYIYFSGAIFYNGSFPPLPEDE